MITKEGTHEIKLFEDGLRILEHFNIIYANIISDTEVHFMTSENIPYAAIKSNGRWLATSATGVTVGEVF